MSITQHPPTNALIGGRHHEGQAGSFPVYSPQSGELLGEVAR